MPQTLARAETFATPTDRRAALRSLAAAGALLVTPCVAKSASSADADLIALTRRAKALILEADRLYAELDELEAAFEPPSPPSCLLIQAGDEVFAGAGDGDFASFVGKPFSVRQLQIVRSMRAVYQHLSVPKNGAPLAFDFAFLTRATEIDTAAARYLDSIELAKGAAGITSLKAKCDASTKAVRTAWRAVAFTPARTVEGVLAKIDSISDCVDRPKAEEYANDCGAEEVLNVAVAEIAELLKACRV